MTRIFWAAFLTFAVSVAAVEDHDDTNINICITVNVGDPKKHPKSGLCDTNSTKKHEEPTVVPRRSLTDLPRPTICNDLDWTNWKVEECDEDDCERSCGAKGWKQSTCVDDNDCHCYNSFTECAKDPDWKDEQLDDCMDIECNNTCHSSNRFIFGICMDEALCHCWRRERVTVTGVRESEEESDRTTALEGSDETSDQYYTTELTVPPDWNNSTLSEDCENELCMHYCAEHGYFNGVCITKDICHCWSHAAWKGSKPWAPSWMDRPVTSCTAMHCKIRCQIIGFVNGVCADEDRCHCYEPAQANGTQWHVTNPPINSIQPWTDIGLDDCTLEDCLRICMIKGYEEGVCATPTSCHCYQLDGVSDPQAGWTDFPGECTVESCNEKCISSGYIEAICMDFYVCHCYDLNTATTLTTTSGITEIDFWYRLCLERACITICWKKKFLSGICTTPKNCHCSTKRMVKHKIEHQLCFDKICKVNCIRRHWTTGYCTGNKDECECEELQVNNPVIGLTKPIKHTSRQRRNGGRVTRKVPEGTRDPNLNVETKFTMKYCMKALCNRKCKKLKFMKGHCKGNTQWCICIGRTD